MKDKYNSVSDEVKTAILSEPQVSMDDANEMTIDAMAELVSRRVADSTLCDIFLSHNKILLESLASKMKVSVFQCIFLSVLLDQDETMTYSSIARYIDCSVLRLKSHQSEVDDLIERHIIARDGRKTRHFTITDNAIEAFCRNEPYEYNVPNNLTTEQLLQRTSIIIDIYHSQFDDDDYEPLWQDIEELLEHNQHIPFAKALLNADDISTFGRAMLLYMAEELFFHNKSFVTQSAMDGTFAFDLHNETSGQFEILNLEDLGYIEAECMDGMRDNERFCLSDKACRTIFIGLGLEKLKDEYFNIGMVDASNLPAKELFYNTEDEKQVTQLYELLKQDNFENICKRLESEGLRNGFACLFYGSPGCGKTETVYQIAKATGRSIVEVNVSDIMSKWVGDSEKHIKRLFSKYKEKVHHLDKTPILLFNEADSIIHRRHTQIDHAVDQMSNSIQNIILQEMESLEGIMIATTNLTENLDKAFDRRFLYKIEFHKPDITTKSKIWLSMMPDLTTEEADSLAREFDFTGGEIENVVRKSKISYILTGEKYNYETIQSTCCNETVNTGKKKIGF